MAYKCKNCGKLYIEYRIYVADKSDTFFENSC